MICLNPHKNIIPTILYKCKNRSILFFPIYLAIHLIVNDFKTIFAKGNKHKYFFRKIN